MKKIDTYMDREIESLLRYAEEHNKKWSKIKREESKRMKIGPVVVGNEEELNGEEKRSVDTECETECEDDTEDVVVWGEIQLSSDELSLLKLGPGYMVVSCLDSEEQRVEENVAMTKIRWTKMKTGSEEMTGHQEDLEEPETAEDELEAATLQDLLDNQARDVINPEGTGIDMGRKRATDMRGNITVYMPGPSIPIVEAEYTTRLEVWKKEFEKFKSVNCDKKGKQKVNNLSASQSRGLLSLSKRVAKQKKFVVVDESTYVSMAEDHTRGDIHLDRSDVADSQRILSTTAKSLANIVNLGTAHSDKKLCQMYGQLRLQGRGCPSLEDPPKGPQGTQ